MENKLWLKVKEILTGIDKVENENEEDEEDLGWWETSVGARFGKIKLTEIESAFDELYPTHYMVADNSDAFRNFLLIKRIPFVANGHFTGIPFEGNDIFRIAMEWGVYVHETRKAAINKNPLES